MASALPPDGNSPNQRPGPSSRRDSGETENLIEVCDSPPGAARQRALASPEDDGRGVYGVSFQADSFMVQRLGEAKDFYPGTQGSGVRSRLRANSSANIDVDNDDQDSGDERTRLLSKSYHSRPTNYEVLDSGALAEGSGGQKANYSTFTEGSNGQSAKQGKSNPVIFCIHGNKYGFAKCCSDLEDNGNTSGEEKGTALTAENGQLPSSGNVAHSHSSKSDHCHNAATERGVDKRARNKLLLALILCVCFMIIEVIGGYLSGSLAVFSDAAHLLTDVAAFLISLLALYLGSRPPSQTMSFGYYRIEVIGAILSVFSIWVITGVLVYMAVLRIQQPEQNIDATSMLITSGIGLLFNIIMGCTLHQSHGHSHGGGGSSHGHSHGGGGNINVTTAYIHVLGDFVQSAGVFIAAIMIYFKPEWEIADPICTFIFSVIVLVTTLNVLKKTVVVLMEGMPSGITIGDVESTFLSVEGIQSAHSIRIWSLTTEKVALAAHLAVAPGTHAQTVLKEASVKIREKYDIFEMTLQIEDYQDEMENCQDCQNPK